MKKQRRFIIGLYALAWTLVGLVSGSKASVLFVRYLTAPVSRAALVWWQVAVWWLWGLFTPLVLALGRRFPLERDRLRRNAWLHIAGSLLFAAAHMAVSSYTGQLVLPVDMGRLPFRTVFLNTVLNDLHFELLIYWGVLGSGYAYNYYRRYRERELAAAHLQRQLAEAQLQALKMQLHPHFLFNTLNTIATLARKQEMDAVVQMLAGLGDLLRHTLEQADKQEVPLREELDFIERYLALEQARFHDRLTVRMKIAPETLTAAVPSLILQPLVENAVRHGVTKHATAGVIEISAARAAGKLRLLVSDDGPGLPDAFSVETEGIGLRNTRARLARLYGDEHSFALRNGVGLTVEMVIPFHALAAQ